MVTHCHSMTIATIATLGISLGVVSTGCETALIGDDRECLSEYHCTLVDGVPTCEDGYAREEPNDAARYRCVPVSRGAGPIMATFAAIPAVVVANEATTVNWIWSFSNGPDPQPTCTISNGVGTMENGASSVITLAHATVFTIECVNTSGRASISTSVSVTDRAIAPVIASFTATPRAVVATQATTITWSFTFASSPTPTPVCSIDHGIGTVTRDMSTTVTLSEPTTFTLTCTNTAGTDTAQSTVSVVPAAVAPVLSTFSATPSAVTNGVPTMITWSWAYANNPTPRPTCSIDHGIGTMANNDSSNVALTQARTYTLTCSNSAGSDTAQATVTVVAAPVAPVIATFASTPSLVTIGVPATLVWSWTFANNPTPAPACTIDNGVGAVPNHASSYVTMSSATTYTLTCRNSAGSDTAQVTVGVAAAPIAPELSTFSAAPAVVTVGVPTTLTWSWSYANSPTPAPVCNIDNGVGTIANNGTSDVTLSSAMTYTVTCSNSAGSDTQQATVGVVAAAVAPDISTFTATPSVATTGVPTTVAWSWTYANSPTPAPTCTIDNGVGTLASGSSSSVTLSAATTYTLTCVNDGGSDTAQKAIAVVAAPVAPIIAAVTVSPASVTTGAPTDVTWDWTYANSPTPSPTCTADNGLGTMWMLRHTTLTLAASATYTLTCSNAAGSDSEEVLITTHPYGNLDSTFGTGGVVLTPTEYDTWEEAAAAVIQPDGKIVAVGTLYDEITNYSYFAVARYNVDGTLDTGFGTEGKTSNDTGGTSSFWASAVAIQGDGKIVVAGTKWNSVEKATLYLARYYADGTLDSWFGLSGFAGANDMVIQPDGKILVVGSDFANEFTLARFNADPSLDTTFGVNGVVKTDVQQHCRDEAMAVALQADGKIVVAGTTTDTKTRIAIARYSAAGTLDTSFGGTGTVITSHFARDSSRAFDLAIQADGRILVAGSAGDDNGSLFLLARYRADGSLDPDFGFEGMITASIYSEPSFGHAVAVQPDGKIIQAGFSGYSPNYRFGMIRYLEDGWPDVYFGTNGEVSTARPYNDQAYAVVPQTDGKIVLVGCSWYPSSNPTNRYFLLARYVP